MCTIDKALKAHIYVHYVIAAENRTPHCRHSKDSQYKQPFVFDYEFSV